jgi:uncharacterized membrane protein YozB (DUF420 family)
VTAFPITGFLGTGATFAADLNLVVQIAMGIGLMVGGLLARLKRYTAHGICQTTVLVLNLFMIGIVMWPSVREQVMPALGKGLHRNYYVVAEVHGLLGAAAELLGLYIVAVTRTRMLPDYLCFTNWKRWMRLELVLWWVVLVSGFGTYYWWYVEPFRLGFLF